LALFMKSGARAAPTPKAAYPGGSDIVAKGSDGTDDTLIAIPVP
jgi:hypothetical protein